MRFFFVPALTLSALGDLLTEFPYLAPPHTNRSPMEAGLETVGQAGHAR
jgi:hypothetical protein